MESVMGVGGRVRGALARRSWPIASAPTRQLWFLFVVELLTLGWVIQQIASVDPIGRDWLDVVVIILVAIGFEEGATRAARLRLRIGSELKQDLTSVWALAAAVALPGGLAVLALACILTYTWLRQQRPAGESLYGTLFNTADTFASCLSAGIVARSINLAWPNSPWALAMTLAVLAALVTYGVVNRILVTGALISAGLHGRALIGTKNENLVEFATLCLGGMVAVAVVAAPWLALLVIAPLGALQRSVLVHQFEEAATTDSKTGLLNAIAWEHVAEREISRSTRNGTTAAVLIVDIDRFKLVNDKFGHLAGDKVLRAVGHCLTSELREYDTVGRFGGEEFVAVLPEADDMDSLIAAERLRSRVNSLDLQALLGEAGEPHEMSVSVGVAVFPTHGTELAELLREADAALYRAKGAGRNRVMLAERGRGTPSAQPVLQT
jgi:diguanylate cyclase (GGDEF)-like protein